MADRTQSQPLDGGMGGGSNWNSLGSPLEREPGQLAKLMRKPGQAIVIWVGDKSPSMDGYGTAPEDGINQGNMQFLRHPNPGCHYTVAALFLSGHTEVVLQLQSLDRPLEVDSRSFLSRRGMGGTLLWETVYKLLSFLLSSHDNKPHLGSASPDLQVVVNVFTDGEDNKSKPRDRRTGDPLMTLAPGFSLDDTSKGDPLVSYPSALKQVSSRCRAKGWLLQLIRIGGVEGVEQGKCRDAKFVAEDMGFNPLHASNVEASTRGVTTGTETMTTHTLDHTMVRGYNDKDGTGTGNPQF